MGAVRLINSVSWKFIERMEKMQLKQRKPITGRLSSRASSPNHRRWEREQRQPQSALEGGIAKASGRNGLGDPCASLTGGRPQTEQDRTSDAPPHYGQLELPFCFNKLACSTPPRDPRFALPQAGGGVSYLTRCRLNSSAAAPSNAIIPYSKPCAPISLPLRNTSRITTK